ncbi:uncharacterized protein LOC125028867 isoform X2 [Penaeus chinensis]|uniref:uncharacterized protein LOC125028867 isoform X2 n=1 Tax=Penaeus chinensis TaxID=139456 RepID=UPI001FB7711F|nr:uncharacterized protein LOC125028867 isoform X2 [Penaeus chinensis]
MGNAAKEIQVNPRECRICIEDYDAVTRRPRFLPCGHTFCTECIDDMLAECVLTCPNCRAEHKALNVNDFPVAAIVEDFMMYCLFLEEGKIPEFEPEESADSLNNGNSENGSLCRMLDTLRDEELACSRTLISSCNEMFSEFNRYNGCLLEYKKHHQNDLENLQKVIDLHNAAIGLLEKEIKMIDALKEMGAKEKEVLLSAVNSLLSARTSEEVETAIVSVDQKQLVVEQWFHKCDLIPDHDAICLSVKLRKATSEVLETLCCWMDGNILDHKTIANYAKSTSNSELKRKTIQPRCLKDFTTGLMEKLHHYIRKYESVIPTESITAYVKAGHSVCAVSVQDGGFRFARFSESSDSIFLHCLQERIPNSGLYTIPFRKVEIKDFSSGWKGFFVISWPIASPRRVIIEVLPNVPVEYSRVLFMLLTGSRGQSYLNSDVEMNYDEDSGEEIIFGKNCMYPATLPFPKERLVRDEVGLVDVGVDGRVWITLEPSNAYCMAVGKVFSGMDVLREAAEFHDISKVQVVDCGIVLPR